MNDATPPAATPRRATSLIIALIALAAGLGFAWLAWQPVAAVRRLAAEGVRVEARVTSVEEQRRRSGSTYFPIFVFRAQDGRMVRQRSSVAVPSPDAYQGRSVMVVYDPADITTARSVESLNAGAGDTPWIAGGMALIAFAFAAFVFLGSRKRLGVPG